MTISSDELKNRLEKYQELLKNCNYVGEICLDEEELHDFAKGLTKYKIDLGKYNYSIGLLILSVNIAYYYYDDNGFWSHFHKITKIDDSGMVGQAVERSLQSNNLLQVQRQGPFRYVGAILEQCGVSRRYIPSFVNVLKEIYRHYGSSIELEYSKIINIMRDIYCSKYLKDFLMDEEGVFFTMQVLKNIKMYEEGYLDLKDLGNLSGFRPGFWDEIFKHFKANQSEDLIVKFIERPQVKLNIQECSLDLFFPSKEVFNGMEKKHLYNYPKSRLSSAFMLQNYFKGEITNSNSKIVWESHGWKPDIYPVLFEKSKRTIIPKSHMITPGSYYLLAPQSFIIPKNIDITFIGKLNCDLKEDFYIYEVNISLADAIPGLKISSNKPQQVNIQFKNTEDKLFELHEGLIDVFNGEIPDLIVSDFSLIEKNVVGLFYDFGKVRGRIKNKNELEELNSKIKKNAPFKGRIWVESLVRNNNITTKFNSHLVFYVIPYLNIIGRERIFSLNQTPQLIVDKNDRIGVNIKDAIRKNKTYTLPADSKIAYGEVVFGNESIEFQFRLKRFGMLDEKGRVVKYLEVSEVFEDTCYYLFGPPCTDVNLYFTNGDEITKTRLNEKGIAKLKGHQLLGSIKNDMGIISLKAFINKDELSLGTCLINSDKFFESYREVNFIPDKKINNIIKVLDLLIDDYSKEPIHLKNMPRVTKKFDQKVLTYFYCSKILDGKDIKIDERKVEWKKFEEENPEIRKLLYAYNTKDWDNSFYSFRSIIPPVKKWTEEIENYIKVYSPNQTPELLKEWSTEVKATVINLRSQLALQKGGRPLSHAWIGYNKNNYNEVLKRLNTIPNFDADIVFDLAELLRIIVFIRQARFKQAEVLIKKEWKTDYFEELRIILESLIMRMNRKISQNESGLLVSLGIKSIIDNIPLRLEDFKLLKLYITFLETKEFNEELVNQNDWLSCWVANNLFNNNEMVASLLKNLKGKIPASKERESILEIINNTEKGIV